MYCHVLLIAKQYLYFCRCRKTFPIFKVFMSRLRKIQNLELVIGYANGVGVQSRYKICNGKKHGGV